VKILALAGRALFNHMATIKDKKLPTKTQGEINIGCRMKDRQIEISIQDNGSGMSEEIRKKLFEPFMTKSVGEGTGLGMAISFGIIEVLDGTIEVESTEGLGSVITVRLPVV
jgi:two-component system NtrC family sensor kinase